jgi:di/tricarboxylate transporter
MEALHDIEDFAEVTLLDTEEVTERYGADDGLFVVRVPKQSELAGRTLGRSRLTDVFDFKVLASFRDANLELLPGGDTELAGGDLLLIQGEPADLDVLRALQGLELDSRPSPKLSSFESQRLVMQDATLDPRSSLVRQSVAELSLRQRYGLELVGLWRNGAPIEGDLRDERLALGDALLLVGPRERLELLERDPDFLILTPLGQAPPDTRRAPLAAGIMFGVVVSVMVAWLPIQIAAVVGGTLMVLTGCLNMEQAYRAIDWRVSSLIAEMLPLGAAMPDTGHPANILVMDPGGYRFADYLRVGVPLTIFVFVVVMATLPVLWRLEPV